MMNKLWPFTFNIALFASIACVLPFIVLYYQELGFSGAQIGVLTGITPLITFFVAPMWTGLADSLGRHRLIMSLTLLGGVITLLIYPFLNSFLPVFLVAVLLYIFLAPAVPFADSATMFMLAGEKEMYGRIRLGGTIGFGLAAPIAGIFVQNYGLRFAFWGAAALLLLGSIVSQKLVYRKMKEDTPAKGRIRIMMSNPRWLLFLIVAFVGGLALAVFNNYFFPYMKEVGANESMMGLALAVGTFSEIPTFFFANRLLKRLMAYGLLLLSMFFTGLRLLLLAFVGTTILVLFIQPLNGLTFSALWVAGVSYADENAPSGMSTTAQGLFSAMVLGIGSAVGGLIGGLLIEPLGGHGLYFTIGTTVLVIVFIVVAIYKRLPAERKTPRSFVND